MNTELYDLDDRIKREIKAIERTVQLAADAWEIESFRSLLQRAASDEDQ